MTLESDTNPPAFPRDHRYNGHNGLTMRDYFAGQALAGLCANQAYLASASWDSAPNSVFVSRAYSLADAMLLSRQNEEKANGETAA